MSEYLFKDAPGFGFDMDDQMETLPMTVREYYASNCADHYGTLHEEIVRCKDCKHFSYGSDNGTGSDWCDFHEHIAWSHLGFCSWAERRKQ